MIKAIAGTLLIVGIAINFFERWYAPNALVTEDSPNFPAWIGWFGWGLATAATLVYVSADVIEWWRQK